MTTLSIIVSMGFIQQRNLLGLVDYAVGHSGDEFDHMAPLIGSNADFELIIVDRAWPDRWGMVKDSLGGLIEKEKLAYMPSKSSVLLDSGYRACCVMRNSGAICSTGDLLAFVDDYIWMDPAGVDRICEYYDETGGIICPVYSTEADFRTPEGPPSDFGGHNSGIYMCTREQFIELNGWDENFDGAYAEEDTEFQNRLDRLLWLRQAGFRKRERGLVWPITRHENGKIVQNKIRPFETKLDDGGYLRCNKAYYDAVCHGRIDKSNTRGNTIPSDEEIKALAEYKCTERCSICNREDRSEQVASYQKLLVVDETIGKRTKANNEKYSGKVNPWG